MYILLVILAALSRLMPHPANVAPIGALALFAGTYALSMKSTGSKTAAFVLPFVAMLASDLIIGTYTWQVMLSVYLGFAITLGLGLLVRKQLHWSTVVAASLVSSVIFFLLTNAAVWAFTPMYTKDFAGLTQSYVAALPFFRNSLLGDLAYTGVLFGMYAVATNAQLSRKLHLATAND